MGDGEVEAREVEGPEVEERESAIASYCCDKRLTAAPPRR